MSITDVVVVVGARKSDVFVWGEEPVFVGKGKDQP